MFNKKQLYTEKMFLLRDLKYCCEQMWYRCENNFVRASK